MTRTPSYIRQDENGCYYNIPIYAVPLWDTMAKALLADPNNKETIETFNDHFEQYRVANLYDKMVFL